jgi:subtilase family serine protease
VVITIALDIAPGAYYLVAQADADVTVTERQESNNTRVRAISVTGPQQSD